MFEMIPFRGKGCHSLKRSDLFDNLLGGFFDNDFTGFEGTLMNRQGFKVDVQEIDNSYVIKADMPGVKKEDINVTYDNNYLTISTKRDEIIEEKNSNYIRRERNYGELARRFYVEGADIEKITASFENGVLTINLPKGGNKPNRKIDIN